MESNSKFKLSCVLILVFALLLSACGSTSGNSRSPAGPGSGGRGNTGAGPGGAGPGEMGPGMGPGNMGSGGMGPGMMGGSGQPQGSSGTSYPTATPGGSAKVSFHQDVLPILTQNCVKCHGGEGGLYLDNYDHVMAGGSSGAVVIPGKPDQSELVERIEGVAQPRMPLDAPALPSNEINTIVTWVEEGAPNN